MIDTGDLRKGLTIELDGQLYHVLDYQHIKMGRGSAQVRLRLRDMRAGHTIERTFQAGERFMRARLDTREAQYLYEDGDLYHFMDTETFEQFALSREQLGDALSYLKEEMKVTISRYRDEPIGVDIPLTVELTVAETGPAFKGDTAQGSTKPATLETGLVVQVPYFIDTGDTIRVDTRDGSYVQKVS